MKAATDRDGDGGGSGTKGEGGDGDGGDGGDGEASFAANAGELIDALLRDHRSGARRLGGAAYREVQRLARPK